MLARPSRPSLAAFYAARLRRLLPVLLLVSAATCLASMLMLAPLEQVAQAELAASVPWWLSNLALATRAVSYFGVQAGTLVFQHTWSLGLEEQFYLVWPLVLMMALRGGRAAWRALPGLALLLAVSLAWCLYASARQPVEAYYLLPTRFWQFALGGCLALWADPELRASVSARRAGGAIGLLGVLLLALSATMFDGDAPYPGWRALVPSLGTAAVLYAGGGGVPRSTRWLTTPAMQWLGRLSYGWYLWHWPVLLLGAALQPQAGWPLRAAWMGLALLLAWVSFHAVESPLRHARALRRRPRATIAGALVCMTLAAWGAQGWLDAARAWQQSPAQRRFLLATADLPKLYGQDCDDRGRALREALCSFGPADAPRTAVVVGDSVGLQWFPALERIYTRDGWRLVAMTRSSCPMIDMPHAARAAELHGCEAWRAAARAAIAKLRPQVVIVGSTVPAGITPQEHAASAMRFAQTLRVHAGTVVVLAPTPRLAQDGIACLARRAWQPAWLPSQACLQPVPVTPPAPPGAPTGVAMIDTNDLVCPGQVCRAERDGVIVFRDRLHLGTGFVRSLEAPLRARLQAAGALPP